MQDPKQAAAQALAPVGIDARLVTITGIIQGVISEVPRRLGQAFFWLQEPPARQRPPGTTVQLLR
jgi:hypothetical protein